MVSNEQLAMKAKVKAREKLQSLARDGLAFRLLDALLTHAPTEVFVDAIVGDIIAAASSQPGSRTSLKTSLLLPSKLPVMINRSPTRLKAYLVDSEGRWADATGFVSSFARRGDKRNCQIFRNS